MRVSAILISGAFACAVFGFSATSRSEASQGAAVGRFADRLNPSNSWQSSVREPAPAPRSVVSQGIRDARNRYADKVLGAHMPLDELEDKGGEWAGSIGFPVFRDVLPDFPNQAVVVARFQDFDFVLTDSKSAIYTEIRFRVERVITSAAQTLPGPSVTVIVKGGTVKLPSGRVLRFMTRPCRFMPVPGHRYILFLQYVADGDFYLLQKSIELSGNKALPNSEDDVSRAGHGTWPFLDQDEEAVVQNLDQLLRTRKAAAK